MRSIPSTMSIMMRLLLLLFLLVFCLLCNHVVDCVDPVECPDGAWGGSDGKQRKKPRLIKADRVNDDYCDCPITGADEPNTSACAGSMDWPGVHQYQQDDKKKEEEFIFACPQQPKLKLAASKLNDGICDCCDGADEKTNDDSSATTCVDDCDVVLAEERRQREKFKVSYEKGNKRRLEELAKYETFRKEQLEKISKLEADLFFVEKQASQTDELYKKAQLQWIHQRLNQVSSRVMAVATLSPEHPYVGDKTDVAQLKGMFETLSTTELEWLIVHACQMAGEMTTMEDDYPSPPPSPEGTAPPPSSLLPSPWDPPRSRSTQKKKKRNNKNKNHGGNGKTCIPLRLAGLDAAIMWEPETYKFVHVGGAANDSSSSSSNNENGDDENDRKRELAELLAYNMQAQDNDDPIVWHAKNLPNNKKNSGRGSNSRRNRRRLSEMDEDWDDYEDEEYDNYHSDDDDVLALDEDDYDDEEEDEDDPYRNRRGRGRISSPDSYFSSDDNGNGDANKHAEMKTLIQNQSFSKSRVLFLERSDFLIKKIDQITEQQEDAAANEKNTEEQQQGDDADAEPAEKGDEKPTEEPKVDDDDDAATSSLSFDPMALPMTKNQLQKRRGDIERGLNYAVSSRVLLDSLRQAVLGEPEKEEEAGDEKKEETAKVIDEAAVERQKQHLQSLAMMTINHGQLSALQVWQLFQSVIPELSTTSPNDEAPAEDTCQAPWAGSCPPRSIVRTASNGAQLSIPPAPIFKLAQAFCDGSLSSDNSSGSSSAYRPELACANPAEIPNTVSDGLFGYVSVQPRSDETDLMSHVFEGLSLWEESSDRTELKELEQEKERLEKEKNDMKNELDDLISSIGGKDEDDNDDPKFGPNGELHAIRDSCFSVDAGKYTYELCMFKQATQRDLGQKHGGTNLGKFHGASVDEESGQRVWKWDHGAKCWNGPMRSATALVTCGEETKVLSADEPDTCRYVFEVESYIACDEDFRVQYGL